MGRGRSKAKQTKVARDLKYSNQDMDLERLAKELHGEVKMMQALMMKIHTVNVATQHVLN